jgi:hypothetical protein
MNDNGARSLRPFNLKSNFVTGRMLALAARHPSLPSSSNRLIGPPGMMVEMACL